MGFKLGASLAHHAFAHSLTSKATYLKSFSFSNLDIQMCNIEYALRLRCSFSTYPTFLRFMIDKYLCHTCFHTESYVMDQIFYPRFLFKKCVISQVFFVLIKQRPSLSCTNKFHTLQENLLDKWEPLVSLLIEKRFFICILFCLS